MALRRSSVVRCVYWRETYAGTGYLLCEDAMLCQTIGALASKNDTAGFELPIRHARFETTD
jgi:hypothetical protein